ncbi:uncharacterized protein LOC114730899 [Neltuma alba]|uniref:uncharacterized protein LOC114730899 n=1 Tax=Neltuma alba TaxID=207710 RepID=UPI0010A4F279|nr:uncharacterized protein LOC114730899 [Prosopis alba]
MSSVDGVDLGGAKWKSFKHAVTHEKDDKEVEKDWWSNNRWKERIKVEKTPKGPNVIIPQQEMDRLVRRWEKALIVKLLGRMIHPELMESKVQKVWARMGDVTAIDVGSGFFVKQVFDPKGEEINKIVAWIRISKLSLDFYDIGISHVLGSQVGGVLKVDKTTLGKKKGRFARICVKLDLSTPLCPMILVNGRESKIQYKSIYLICLRCGSYRHDADHCPSGMIDARNENTTRGDVAELTKQSDDMTGEGEEGRSTTKKETPTVTPFESWMVVEQTRRF